MKTEAEIQEALPHYYGTELWHKWNRLHPDHLLTDGALYLATAAECFWLMDVISSWQRAKKVRLEEFQVWTLKVREDHSCYLICDDGNKHIVARQFIPYTDFPMSEIKLYGVWSGDTFVIMLTGEY